MTRCRVKDLKKPLESLEAWNHCGRRTEKELGKDCCAAGVYFKRRDGFKQLGETER